MVLDSMARALTIGSRMANDARIIEFDKGLEDEPPNSSASDGDARRKMTPLEIHQRTLTHSDAMATCILVLGNRLKGKQPYSQIALARALGTFPEDLEALDLPTDDKITNRKRNNASIIPERLGKKGYGLLDASDNVGSGHSDQIDATELLHDIFANDLGPSFERLCEKTLGELRKLRGANAHVPNGRRQREIPSVVLSRAMAVGAYQSRQQNAMGTRLTERRARWEG